MPIPNASCGVPLTVTGRVNVTDTSICSSSSYVLLLAGLLAIAAPFTADAVNVPPATLWLELLSIAFAPSPSSASNAPPATSIDPLFSDSAFAAMLIPSLSVSPDTTVYRNTSDAVPVPET